MASRPPHGCRPTCSWSCRANSSTWNGAQSPGSCRLRALPARSQPSLGDAEQAIRCEIKGPPAPRPAAGPGPVRPASAAPPCLPGPGLSQAAHLPTFPPDDTYPPTPNAPASQVPTLPRLLLPAWNTRLAFRTQARLGRQPRAAQGSRPQSGFPTRPRRAASSPRARAEPGHVWSPRAPGAAFVRLAPKASGPNGHVSGESVKNG